MISIKNALEEIISSYPFIEEGLSRGLINYSAFARDIKPKIEKRLYKCIKTGAIVMALKRISERLTKTAQQKRALGLTDLTVRSNLSEITFQNSNTLPEKTRQLFELVAKRRDVLCALSEGVRETTFVVSSELIDDLKKLFREELLLNQMENLSSITIRLPKEVVYIPGVYYQVLKRLAFENINVIEVLSTFTELTVILETKNIDKAFSVLKSLYSLS